MSSWTRLPWLCDRRCRRWLRWTAPAGVILGAAAALAAQQPLPGLPSIDPTFVTGRVIDTVTGLPIAGAVVELGGSRAQPAQITDVDGRFLFQSVRPGTHVLTARAPGYVNPAASASDETARGLTLSVRGGQPVAGLDLRLSATPAIHGRVTDDRGEPVPGVRVRAVGLSMSPLPRSMPLRTATTDDRGEYRVSVDPGEYAVGVMTT
jgi:protocatechuate 3,4-dioxygenase beta subunit